MNTNDEVELLEVPGRQYLMIDGSGDPNTSQAYADAVEALFATAFSKLGGSSCAPHRAWARSWRQQSLLV